jgi:hypothetical protein
MAILVEMAGLSDGREPSVVLNSSTIDTELDDYFVAVERWDDVTWIAENEAHFEVEVDIRIQNLLTKIYCY